MNAIIKTFPKLAPYIVCFTAALFFAYELMQLHMLNAIAPMLMDDLNLNAAQVGLLGSTYLLADVFFLIPAGIILDKVSTRKVILVAMILCILGTFGFAVAPNFGCACFAHFISGIGNAFCFLSCIILIARWFSPSKQSLIVGCVITIGMFGGFIAQSPFSALAQALSWRSALFVDGFIGIFVLFLVALFVHDNQAVNSDSSPSIPLLQGLKKSFLNQQNIACGLYISLMNMPLMIIGAVYGSLFLTQVHHISLTQSSFVISMICVGTILGSPLFGYLGNISSKKQWMAIGSLFSTLIFLVILYTESMNLFSLITLFLLLGVFTSSQVLGYPLITAHADKELMGTSTSVGAVIIMGLPMFFGPLVGTIMDRFSLTIDGVTSFSTEGFNIAFLIFPLGFFTALCLLSLIKEQLAVFKTN
jgi:predicted MFS family arabinose efflux permease